jgi:hypothetical protein
MRCVTALPLFSEDGRDFGDQRDRSSARPAEAAIGFGQHAGFTGIAYAVVVGVQAYLGRLVQRRGDARSSTGAWRIGDDRRVNSVPETTPRMVTGVAANAGAHSDNTAPAGDQISFQHGDSVSSVMGQIKPGGA